MAFTGRSRNGTHRPPMTSKDKMWETFPGYAHDSEFEADRSLLDNEVVKWIREYVVQIPGEKITQ